MGNQMELILIPVFFFNLGFILILCRFRNFSVSKNGYCSRGE